MHSLNATRQTRPLPLDGTDHQLIPRSRSPGSLSWTSVIPCLSKIPARVMVASAPFSIPPGFSGHLFQLLSAPDPLQSPAQAPLFPRDLPTTLAPRLRNGPNSRLAVGDNQRYRTGTAGPSACIPGPSAHLPGRREDTRNCIAPTRRSSSRTYH